VGQVRALVHDEQVVAGLIAWRPMKRQGGPAVDFRAVAVVPSQGRDLFLIGSVVVHGIIGWLSLSPLLCLHPAEQKKAPPVRHRRGKFVW